MRRFLILLSRLGHLAVIVATVTIILSHFGISATAVMAVLGLSGLALSLAARDTIEDAIAGMIILLDRPFGWALASRSRKISTWATSSRSGCVPPRIRTRDTGS